MRPMVGSGNHGSPPNSSLQATKTRHTMYRKLVGQLVRVFAPEL
ncbi:MAG: hypothetical protein WC538_15880 [Thermoanaerobaculia bacterium]